MKITLPDGFKNHSAFDAVTTDTGIIQHICDTLKKAAEADSYPLTVRFTLSDLPLTEALLIQTWISDLVCGDSTEAGVMDAARTQLHVEWEGAVYSGYPMAFATDYGNHNFVFIKS